MEKTNIRIEVNKCAGCLCCQLRCSLAYTGAFNPEKAKIIIDLPREIIFRDDCVKGCTLCARYCDYGALTLE